MARRLVVREDTSDKRALAQRSKRGDFDRSQYRPRSKLRIELLRRQRQLYALGGDLRETFAEIG